MSGRPKVRVLLDPADASRLKRLAEQAVASLKPLFADTGVPKEEKDALEPHLLSMQRVVAAVREGQRKLANKTLK